MGNGGRGEGGNVKMVELGMATGSQSLEVQNGIKVGDTSPLKGEGENVAREESGGEEGREKIFSKGPFQSLQLFRYPFCFRQFGSFLPNAENISTLFCFFS